MPELKQHLFDDITSIQRQMERLLSHFANAKQPTVRFSPHVWVPAIDVYETEEDVVIRVELAGVREEDMDISVDRDHFILRGQRRDTTPPKRRTYYQMEISCGPFERIVNLPSPVDPDGAQASYRDGFLEICLPKVKVDLTQTLRIKP
ncbi:MAG: Hsp20/alpha crystallin family protein [Chloroflexi bacterium]|nr:Hsp20/alpha crystallin family protein [Chloroflexota bacterium]